MGSLPRCRGGDRGGRRARESSPAAVALLAAGSCWPHLHKRTASLYTAQTMSTAADKTPKDLARTSPTTLSAPVALSEREKCRRAFTLSLTRAPPPPCLAGRRFTRLTDIVAAIHVTLRPLVSPLLPPLRRLDVVGSLA